MINLNSYFHMLFTRDKRITVYFLSSSLHIIVYDNLSKQGGIAMYHTVKEVLIISTLIISLIQVAYQITSYS